MSRFPTLRNALVVALAVSSMGGLCCPEPIEETRVEQLKKDELTAELEDCLDDDLACDELCYQVLRERGYDLENGYRPQFTECTVDLGNDANRPIVRMSYYIPEDCVGGRRPAGATSAPCRAPNPVAAHLIGIAHLEAISIHAFIELARDLREHGAPSSLIRRALASASDEVEHAIAVATLARRFGATPITPSVTPRSRRALVDIAVTNAVEGCVRELYGAVVALWQGRHAADGVTREVFAKIAEDELRHAELAFDIDRWVRGRLKANECVDLDAETRAARAALATDAGGHDTVVTQTLGLPGPGDAKTLIAATLAASSALRAT